MKFISKEEMISYETARENYYMEFINAIDRNELGKFYKLLLREIFIPKYRRLKKEYDNYSGGYYIDNDGIVRARNIFNIPIDEVPEGSICITSENEIYKKIDNMYLNIT